MVNRLSPGCGCCDGYDCSDFEFLPPFSDFGTVEGTYESEEPAHIDMSDGDVLEHGSSSFFSGAQAWHHEISVSHDADFDLEWDGITFEFRGSAGTITNGTDASIFIPSADMPSTGRTKVTLYVTPSWYAIMVLRPHPVFVETSVVSTRSTRGSIQVIDRSNGSSPQGAKLTARSGGAKVFAWDVVDSTILVSGSAVAVECDRPEVPVATERTYQHHRDFLASDTVHGVETQYPDEFETIGSVFVKANDPDPDFAYDGELDDVAHRGSGFGSPRVIDWVDSFFNHGPSFPNAGRAQGIGFSAQTAGFGKAFGIAGNVSPTGGTFAYESAQITGASSTYLPDPTASVPYPKPANWYGLSILDFGTQQSAHDPQTVIVPLNETSRAPATITTVGSYDATGEFDKTVTSWTLRWTPE